MREDPKFVDDVMPAVGAPNRDRIRRYGVITSGVKVSAAPGDACEGAPAAGEERGGRAAGIMQVAVSNKTRSTQPRGSDTAQARPLPMSIQRGHPNPVERRTVSNQTIPGGAPSAS